MGIEGDIMIKPLGMFLITHNEILGPEIKQSYFTKQIEITKEFISQLYMSHAGFGHDFNLEMKFNQYKVISVFTGNMDRKTDSEGILAILFEDHESSENLELFLRRNLSDIIKNRVIGGIKQVFIQKLKNYLKLIDIFEKFKIENISEIFLITGDEKFKNCLLKLSYKKVSNTELSDIYEKIVNSKRIPNYQYYPLNLDKENNIYLLLKVLKSNDTIKKIIDFIIPYLELSFNYSLEILSMFFIPHLLNTKNVNNFGKLTPPLKQKNVLNHLKDSDNYSYEFNSLIFKIINQSIYLEPIKNIK